jgi:hypothetical protein
MSQLNYIDQIEQLIAEKTAQHKKEGKELGEHFTLTYESLKPINILKSTLEEARLLPESRAEILMAGIRFTTKQIVKRLKTNNMAMPLANVGGLLLEMVVAQKLFKGRSQNGLILAMVAVKAFGAFKKHNKNAKAQPVD